MHIGKNFRSDIKGAIRWKHVQFFNWIKDRVKKIWKYNKKIQSCFWSSNLSIFKFSWNKLMILKKSQFWHTCYMRVFEKVQGNISRGIYNEIKFSISRHRKKMPGFFCKLLIHLTDFIWKIFSWFLNKFMYIEAKTWFFSCGIFKKNNNNAIL